MVELNTNLKTAITAIYQQQSRRVFATLIRLLGDFDLTEEALHEPPLLSVLCAPK